MSKTEPKVITRIERNMLKTVIFTIVFVLVLSIIDTFILLFLMSYSQRVKFGTILIFFESVVTSILIIQASFLKEKVEYETVSEQKTWYGSEVKYRRIEK